jgi:hypothetical protein
MLPRGVRNGNPGNIDRCGVPWQGEDRTDAARTREQRFCVFLQPQFGFRAMARVLLTYRDKHGLNTVRQLIHRWAPPVENDTGAYVRAVAKAIGVDPDQHLELGTQRVMLPLLRAIAHHEQGGDHWGDDVIVSGINLAGIKA